MAELTRTVLFQMASAQLRADFEALAAIPHSGLKGTEAETLLRRFLDGHLPRRFATGSGFILDRTNAKSKQTDLVIYDALNCPVYRASETAGIYPNDNVAAVIEVKSTLDSAQLRSAAENIAVAKALRKSTAPALPYLVTEKTLGCLFAFGASVQLRTLADNFEALLRESGSLGRHIDVIAVLDVGLITLASKPRGLDWSVALIEGPTSEGSEGMHIGVGHQALGVDTLDAFFRFLLMHLAFYRGVVDHPGFDLRSSASQGRIDISYLTSVTYETDPVQRAERLKQYQEEARRDFSQGGAP